MYILCVYNGITFTYVYTHLIFHTSFRYCVRLTPVSVVCPANIDDIKRNVKDVFKEFHNESSEPLKVQC